MAKFGQTGVLKMRNLILGIVFLFGSYACGQDNSLSIKIEGIKSERGKILYTVFSDNVGFPSDVGKAIQRGLVHIKNGMADIRLDLPNGEYAVMVFHDEDDDNELKTNWFGMPKEGVGNSNNHKGIPSFKKSVFKLVEDKSIMISLWYM